MVGPFALVAPLALGAGAALGAWIVPRRLHPRDATRVLTGLSVVAAGSVVWALVLVAFASLVELHGIAERIPWCADIVTTHRDSLSPVGMAVIGMLLGIAVTVGRVLRRHRSTADLRVGSEPIAVLPVAEPIAFAVPGKPGQVVVSQGMLAALDADERRALLAHERAHLAHHHHRYRRAADCAAAVVPFLRPVSLRVRFATERWADEEAARDIGDRVTVARAVARAALAGTATPGPVLAAGDLGVPARVDALLAPEPTTGSDRSLILLASACTVALATSAVASHHWLAAALRLC